MIKEIKIGTCANCAKKVFDFNGNHFVKNKNYDEIWFYLNIKSKMRVPVCKDCKKIMNDNLIKEIMYSHNHTWEKEFKESKKIPKEKIGEKIKFWNKIKCLKWANSEKELDSLIINI